MRRNPETKVLIEQALRHVLSEQAKLLDNAAYAQLSDIFKRLNTLANTTAAMSAEGFPEKKEVLKLTRLARSIEKRADDLSKKLWSPVMVNVSAIYERIEESFDRKDGQVRLREDTRAHYHDMRIRLLEQTIGARGLINNNDLGDENERIWLQFLEQQLGPMFRVLRGGVIRDHSGNESGQIDLIIVPADAQVMAVSDAKGGKAMVYIDQVISAIMVGSTLSPKKLKEDWTALQKVPGFSEKEKDYANLKGHTWPLCYIVSSRSDVPDRLKDEWRKLCASGPIIHLPQLVITLDTGFMYGGRNVLAWPAPHTNSFDTMAEHVGMQSGLHAGLGLGWLLIQHQGRLAAMRRHAFGHVTRQATQLVDATMSERAGSPTCGKRAGSMSRMSPVYGVIAIGWRSFHVHNQLELCSASIRRGEVQNDDLRHAGDGTNPKDFRDWAWFKRNLRWFRYGKNAEQKSGDLLALEEWFNAESKTKHQTKIAVFNTTTGEELSFDATNHPSTLPETEADWAAIRAAVNALGD